jgi:hypothetical protein
MHSNSVVFERSVFADFSRVSDFDFSRVSEFECHYFESYEEYP